MKILLLQSSVYLPSFGGGNKSNRLLLEALAARGHECWSISKSVDSQTVVDQRSEMEVLKDRKIELKQFEFAVSNYVSNDVNVLSVDINQHPDNHRVISQQYQRLMPDIILVSDDKNGDLLALALRISTIKTVLIVHTNLHLPFGDEATTLSKERLNQYQQCPHILTSTQYTKAYLARTSGITSDYIPFPVYGDGPFNNHARFNQGHIGMINPCAVKGVSIFIELAKRLPQLSFMAIPTWGANQDDIQQLSELDNMIIVEPEDNIQAILEQLTVLVVPSLIPETFGYVTVEAMLRGIPVLASDYGGLRDAKLGVDYLLPITPAVNRHGHFEIPSQTIEPWEKALTLLSLDQQAYQRCSEESHYAANDYHLKINIAAFEHYFNDIKCHPTFPINQV